MEEIICNEDEREYNFKFTVTGTFIGDKGETINQERILNVYRLTDSNEAWRLLSNADFELESDENVTTQVEDSLNKEVQNLTEVAQQLWECLRRGYSYNEAQIHMRAFRDGKTTVKEVVVIDKEDV